MTRLGVLPVLLVLALGACASQQPKPKQAQRQGNPEVAASASADSLAAAALQTWATGGGAEQALFLARNAAERESGRRDLIWLQIRLCAETRGCQSEPEETQLRKLDAGNGVAWLGALARAQTRRDARAEEQILEAMSRAERFDVYWTTLVSRLSTELSKQTTAAGNEHPLTDALNDTTTWLSKLMAPALLPINTSCSDTQRLRDTSQLARCERIAQAMQRGDTTLVEGMGLGLSQRLVTPGSTTAAVISSRVAAVSYRTQTTSSIVSAQVERDKFSAEMIKLMSKLHREQDVSNAILRWAGQPAIP